MITLLLLILIYLAFISLGLPDSILGVSLPAIQSEWGVPLSSGGLISAVVMGSTIFSSFISGHVIKRFGTGKIVAVSCLMTGGALFGYSMSPSFIWLVILAVPLGLGGGSVDTALNNYVALNYKARHMNWLHSFWGVGATLGPVIMSFYLGQSGSWKAGYRTISLIQLSLAVVLLLSLSLWVKAGGKKDDSSSESSHREEKKRNLFAITGVIPAMSTLLLYCAIEAGIGLWGSSYLIGSKGLSMEKAASWLALYYGGITAGRFLSGFISMKLNNTQMIRMGILTALSGILILLLPLSGFFTGAAIVFIGFGLAPIFPAMLHETPERFGKDVSQVLIGYQMGFAYIGIAVISPLFGVIMQFAGVSLFPLMLLFSASVMLILSERLNVIVKSRKAVLSED